MSALLVCERQLDAGDKAPEWIRQDDSWSPHGASSNLSFLQPFSISFLFVVVVLFSGKFP